MFMTSTPSSALRPNQGATAACEVMPLKVYSTDTAPLLPELPQLMEKSLLTWA